MQYPGMKMQRIRWMYIPLQKTVNALKASPYELLKDLEVPEPDSKIVSLFFQIQRLDKNKKKFALSMVESMLDNLAGL